MRPDELGEGSRSPRAGTGRGAVPAVCLLVASAVAGGACAAPAARDRAAPATSSLAPVAVGPVAAPASEDDTELSEAWRDLRRTAPLSASRLNFLHSTLEVPPLDTAETLPCGDLQLRLKSDHARSRSEREAGGVPHDFDGTYHEVLSAELDWAAAEVLELGVRAVLAGWDEHQDRFRLAQPSGDPLVRDETFGPGGEATARHMNLSVFGLSAKRRLVDADAEGFDLALAPSLKIPFGRERDLTHSGTWDAALTALASVPLDGATLHANLGATVPIGEQSFFVDEADVDLEPFLHGGVAVAVPFCDAWSFVAQLEGNTSAFDDVPFLEDPAATFVFGVRRTTEGGSLELALGTGLDHDRAYQLLVHFGWTVRF